ncbi:hypothetical protein [Bizionia paragorgiae]|uniref:hypothetical protein n=1 Tax=Bizionia paragorgiae TaxID=283786 RepID=UPI003A92CDDF
MISKFINWFTSFFKTYGLAATLILAACLLGIFNLGILGYKFTSITLFSFIAIVYLIFHVPTLWKIIKDFFSGLWRVISGIED